MITEERVKMVQNLSEKHGFGPVELVEGELVIVQWGTSIVYQEDAVERKTLVDIITTPGYAVYETVGFEMDADVSEIGAYPNFLNAVHAMFSRIYEMKIWQELMEMP